MAWERPITLASRSPRSAQLLAEHRLDVRVSESTFDDGCLTCGAMHVERWVRMLAILKAQNVLHQNEALKGTILAADTVCVVDDTIFGQPQSIEEARKMIHAVCHRTHEVLTGWCLAAADGTDLESGVEQAEITIGEITTEEIEQYLQTNQWVGKAGGYNLAERVQEGWPIDCVGDPSTVMGLPMKRLMTELCRSEQ